MMKVIYKNCVDQAVWKLELLLKNKIGLMLLIHPKNHELTGTEYWRLYQNTVKSSGRATRRAIAPHSVEITGILSHAFLE